MDDSERPPATTGPTGPGGPNAASGNTFAGAAETVIQVGRDLVGGIHTHYHLTLRQGEPTTVAEAAEQTRRRPVPRSQIRELPRVVTPPVGRERETGRLLAAAAGHRFVQVVGGAGVGKSTLLRHAAKRLAVRGEAVVFLSARDMTVPDLIQEVYEACYHSHGYVPSRAELCRLLAEVPVTLFLDDFAASADERASLLAVAPAASVVVATRERLSAEDPVIELAGLDEQAALGWLLRDWHEAPPADEVLTARQLWRATGGVPALLRQVRAAIEPAADGPGRLPRVGELAEVLPRLLARLTPDARRLLAALGLAGGCVLDARLWPVVLGEGGHPAAAAAELTGAGLAEAVAGGIQLAAGLSGDSTASEDPAALGQLAARLATWVASADTPPRLVASHVGLIANIVAALEAAGSAEAGARLAQAAATPIARATRLGAWGRVLAVGERAASRAGDARLVAFFTHEDGIRRLVTGDRVAAASVIAAAIVLWQKLGEHGHAGAGQHAQTLAQPPPGGPPATTPPAATPAAGQSGPAGPSASPAGAGAHGHGDPPPGGGGSWPGRGARGGRRRPSAPRVLRWRPGWTAALVVAGSLLAGATIGNLLTQTPRVPIHILVSTALARVSMPGKLESVCQTRPAGAYCATLVQARQGATGPITVNPHGALPAGVRFVYWGCAQPAPARECTVTADHEGTVCITTTGDQDAAARAGCAGAARSPGGTPGGGIKVTVTLGTQHAVSVVGLGGACVRAAGARAPAACVGLVSATDPTSLTATLSGPGATPRWHGCDGVSTSGQTCVLTPPQQPANTGRPARVVCLSSGDEADAGGQDVCARLVPAQPSPSGTRPDR